MVSKQCMGSAAEFVAKCSQLISNEVMVVYQDRQQWYCLVIQAVDGSPAMSPKRRSDGEGVLQHSVKRQVQVLQLRDIQKEFELVNAHLRLMKHSPDLCSSLGKLTHVYTGPVLLTGRREGTRSGQ